MFKYFVILSVIAAASAEPGVLAPSLRIAAAPSVISVPSVGIVRNAPLALSGGLVSNGLVSSGLVTSGLVSNGVVSGGLISGGLINGGLVSGKLLSSGLVSGKLI